MTIKISFTTRNANFFIMPVASILLIKHLQKSFKGIDKQMNNVKIVSHLFSAGDNEFALSIYCRILVSVVLPAGYVIEADGNSMVLLGKCSSRYSQEPSWQ